MSNELATGIYDGISHSDYHAMTDYVSNSYLGKLNKCPAAAKVIQEETPALVLGTAIHCYLFDGNDIFFNQFSVLPSCDRRTKEGKKLYEDFQLENVGKKLISSDDMKLLEEMKNAVYQHPFARTALATGLSEQTVIWRDSDSGIACKCRPDRIPLNSDGVIVDLKTTTDAGEYGFSRAVSSYGYHRQAAMYLDGINAATGGNFDAFIFVAVEKTTPYRVETYLIDDEFIKAGRADYKRLLHLELDCRANGYPNYQTPELVTLYKPKYL